MTSTLKPHALLAAASALWFGQAAVAQVAATEQEATVTTIGLQGDANLKHFHWSPKSSSCNSRVTYTNVHRSVYIKPIHEKFPTQASAPTTVSNKDASNPVPHKTAPRLVATYANYSAGVNVYDCFNKHKTAKPINF